jgi:hypothetical protein
MVVGDPLREGVVTYTLIWQSDQGAPPGSYAVEADWTVVGALADPRSLIEIARSMVCDS